MQQISLISASTCNKQNRHFNSAHAHMSTK